ncbi:MAG: hypothetical protein WKF84_02010 [Pyrinomonadaceae bacterium]
MLKTLGMVKPERAASANVGRYRGPTKPEQSAAPKSAAGIKELAESCVALLELQGRSIDETLTEMSAEHGGWVAGRGHRARASMH